MISVRRAGFSRVRTAEHLTGLRASNDECDFSAQAIA
jgi:hypothetical protein